MLPKPRALPSHIVALLGMLICAVALLLVAFAVAQPVHADTPDLPAQVALPTPTPTVGETTEDGAAQEALNPTIDPSLEPEARVLVERLRLRAGPGEEFPILTRVFTGDVLLLTGQTNACAWLRVETAAGEEGWISGDPALVTVNVPCVWLRQTRLLVPTPTIAPTASDTPTTTPTPSATPLRAPAIALRPAVSPYTPTPLPTLALPTAAARVATATPDADTPAVVLQPTADLLAAIAAVGPRSVSQLTPVDATETRLRIPFGWVADQPLADGQLFELAFWQPGQPQEFAMGWTGATTNSTISANTYEQIPGDYYWGVWLGAMHDGQYHRLRYLGGGNLLRVLPEAVIDLAPSATNCPPTAPCR